MTKRRMFGFSSIFQRMLDACDSIRRIYIRLMTIQVTEYYFLYQCNTEWLDEAMDVQAFYLHTSLPSTDFV